MKTASRLGVTLFRFCVIIVSVFAVTKSIAQTTIINYNFDVATITDYGKFYTRYANGLECLLTSSDAYSQSLHAGSAPAFAGTATGASAFTANTITSPNRVCGVTGTGTKWFDFQLTGSSIKAYSTFKFYFQDKASATSYATINTITYSVDGGAYTTLASPGTSVGTSWVENLYSLPSITPTSSLNIRINFTTSGSSKAFCIDNFQIQAVGPVSTSVAIAPNHIIARNIFQNSTNVLLAGFRMDAHVSTITPSSISLTTAGTYSSSDLVNFKLWQNSYNSLYGATQVGSTIASASSGTTITFNSGLSSFAASTSTYFFLTADVSSSAGTGKTFNITSTAFSNISFGSSPTKIGNDPVTASNTQTITANLNKYTSMSGTSGNWDAGATASRWANSSGGTYNNKWISNGIGYLEGTGGTLSIDGTTGTVAQSIYATVNSYSLRLPINYATTGLILTDPGIIDVSGSNVLKMTNSNTSSNSYHSPLITNTGFVKTGTGELNFSGVFSFLNGTAVKGPIYVNGGTLSIGDKSSSGLVSNISLYDNDFFINNGKLTFVGNTTTLGGQSFLRSLVVNGSGTNNSQIEVYNAASTAPASMYPENTWDDRFPAVSNDLSPLYIKGKLSIGYAGTISGITNAYPIGNVSLTGNATIKGSTNGSGNIASSSGVIMNVELAGEGNRVGLGSVMGSFIGSYTFNDNGYTFTTQGGGSATSDGAYISMNGSGSSSGAWTVGNADGSEANYLAINDVTGLTSGTITVNQNSQLRLNVTGASVTVAKTPTITLNGAKTFSYYGALALYNGTGSSTNTLSTPIVAGTSDATVGLYSDNWTLGGAITGTGGIQLYGTSSTYDLTLTSASNTWSGGTKILSGIMNVSSGSSISTGSLTMGQLSGFSTALNLNNAAQTVSSLSSSWTNTTGTQSQTITLASGHIFTVNQSSNTTYGDGAVSTLTALIAGSGNLIKDGSGTLTLTGANTYTGLTQVKGGILQLNRVSGYSGSVLPSTNNVHIIGGTLQVTTNQTLNDVILSTGTLQVDNGVTLTINGTFTLVNGTINLVGTGKIAYGSSGLVAYAGSSSQTTSTSEIPTTSGPKGIIVDNNTNNGVILNANVANLTGASTVNGWLDFNGKTLTGTGGTFTLNGLIGPYSFTGTTSSTSNVITSVSSTASLKPGMKLISAALPSGTYIIYVDPLTANTVTMNNNASSNTSGASVIATWRGGLKVSLPNGIGDGSTTSHVQVTGSKVYNSGANYVFNTPTSGTSIYPAMPTVGTLTYSPAYNVTIQASIGNKVILGTSQDLEISNDLTLTSGVFVTNNNLITWDNSGGTLTAPNVPFSSLTTTANNSFIATVTNTGAEISPGATYSGSKGFRIKNVGSSTDVYFPVGVNFTSANRVMINNTGTSTDITVLLNTGDLAQTPGSRVNRIWYMNSSASSGVKATMKLFYTKRDWSGWPSTETEVETGFLYNDVHLIQKDYSGNFINKSTGTDVTGADVSSAAYTNYEVYGQYNIGISPDPGGTKNGINSFSRFALVNEYIILPVSITNIKAYKKDANIQVDWISLQEKNIDHYEVEKSLTGINFTSIGKVTARNTGVAQTQYGLTDINPVNGNNFYRIKVTDKNGKVSYTSVVVINITDGKTGISVQPNPITNRMVNLVLSNLDAGKYSFMMYNSIGQPVLNQVIQHIGGSASQSFALPLFVRPGAYTVRIFNETHNFSTRVVVE